MYHTGLTATKNNHIGVILPMLDNGYKKSYSYAYKLQERQIIMQSQKYTGVVS